jgi:uncharacterized membrane protein YgcG
VFEESERFTMTNTKPETLTPGDLVEFKLAPGKPMTVETVFQDGGIGLMWSNESGGPFRQTVRPERLRKIGRRHTDRPSAPPSPAAPAPTGINAVPIDVSFGYPIDPAPAPEPQHHHAHHDSPPDVAAPSDPSPSYSDPSPSPDYSSPDMGGGFDGGGGGDFGGGGSSGDW